MEQRSKRLGQVSLALSLFGLPLFPLGWLICYQTHEAPWLYFGGFIATVVLEAAGVGFGLASRGTIAGKVGLWISLLALTLILGFCCLIFAVLSSGMGGRWG
jgi:hypothetical protein